MGYEVGAADENTALSRKELVIEESDELIEAIESGDHARIAQEAADLIYVCLGIFVSYGLPFRRVWKIVHRANMKKISVPGYRKPIKGPGWKSPLGGIRRLLSGRPRL